MSLPNVIPPKVIKRVVLGIEVLEVRGDPHGAHIVLFHGFGADANDLLPLSGVFTGHPRPTWHFPQAPLEVPIGRSGQGRAWFPIDFDIIERALHQGEPPEISLAFPPDLPEIRQLGQKLILELNIPHHKLFLGGFSQGAVLATDLLLHSPHKLGGLLIFSGTLFLKEKWQTLAPLHGGTPFFQSHGINDPLLPLKGAEELSSLLQNAGLKGSLLTFPGGHEIPSPILLKLNAFLTPFLT